MMNKRNVTLVLVLIASMIAGLMFGGASLTIEEVIGGLLKTAAEKYVVIMWNVRLPRVFAALVAGMGLAMSGLLLQSVTDNPMASPNIIGVNSGAGLMTLIVLSFFPKETYLLPFASFFGAFGATLFIVNLSKRLGSSKTTIILSGLALTTILNACISFISLLNPDVVSIYNYFSIGGLSGVSIEELVLPAVLILISFGVTWVLSQKISILCLGDAMASSLGVRVKHLRRIVLICASFLAASVVCFAGLLGFVGLIVPQFARKIAPETMKQTMISTALCGSILVVIADLAGRSLFAPSEIPVGIMMALIGAPFFLMLLIRRKDYD